MAANSHLQIDSQRLELNVIVVYRTHIIRSIQTGSHRNTNDWTHVCPEINKGTSYSYEICVFSEIPSDADPFVLSKHSKVVNEKQNQKNSFRNSHRCAIYTKQIPIAFAAAYKT